VSKLTISRVAVLGAGVMGAQIAAHLVNAGVPVLLFDLPSGERHETDDTNTAGDVSDGRTTGNVEQARARSAIAQAGIDRLKKLKPAPLGNPDDARYIQAANYDDDLHRLKDCELVIEAIAERLDWKHALYQKVAPHLSETAIFASNTSGLSITALAQGFGSTYAGDSTVADAMPAAGNGAGAGTGAGTGAAAGTEVDARVGSTFVSPAQSLRERFCGVHFFNPPRYMHLLELIPTAQTRPDVLDALETFLTSTLGKGVVRAKDTPNFIANRVGVFSMLAVIKRAEQYGLAFDVVDDLTGARLGRAKSATFRTADVVGLDTLAHVIKTMQDALPNDPFAAVYATPPVLSALVAQGALGQKAGAGFYKKEGKDILVLDPTTAQYRASGGKADELVLRILKKPLPERLRLLRETDHPQAQFLWSIFRDVFHYVGVHLSDIADNARDLDFAVRWGFGWDQGPFETWQAAGWEQVAGWIREDIAAERTLAKVALPEWITCPSIVESGGVHREGGSYSPLAQCFIPRSDLPVYQRQVFRAALVGGQGEADDPTQHGTTVFENAGARLWTLGDASEPVLILSFRSKMNTIGPEVLEAIRHGVALAEAHYQGLVIWQPTSLKLGAPGGPFSAGANLEAAMPKFMKGGAAGVEPFIAEFQQTMLRVKYAQVPVVTALSGIALGGGCELALHAAQRVAHIETYIGLVEIGVGVVPAGGGLKEAAIAAAQAAAQYDSKRLLDFLTPRFTYAATAKVSASAREAQRMGYLKPSDVIVFNVHELLDAGCRAVRALAGAGYRPPMPAVQIPVAGRSAIATIRSQLVNMRDGRFISDHDYLIASRIAEAICGGDVEPGTLVDEAWLLTLERRAFVDLLGTPKTLERIMGLLQGGKPARN